VSRKPSAETELKTVKRQLRDAEKDRDRYRRESDQVRQFLNQSTAQIEEWKNRFDLLLARTPANPDSKHEGT
jgi:septal ring factor EnvC (AmiA/AmiB activator)